MKIKDGYEIKKIANSYVALYLGDGEEKQSSIIQMNETAAFLWEHLKKGCTREELVKAVLNDYDVEQSKAEADVDKILKTMKDGGLLDD